MHACPAQASLTGALRIRVHLNEAGTAFDAAPHQLRYWFEGCEAEPAVTVDERGIPRQVCA